MKILCTFPGKFGDLIWALPTVRAIAEVVGEPVDLMIAGAYASIVPLIQRQSYIGKVLAEIDWLVENTAPMTPRIPPMSFDDSKAYDQVFHLGYRGWPETTLPRETFDCAWNQAGVWFRTQGALHLDLTRPWIEAPYRIPHPTVYAVGFTDEHFELKYGLADLLYQHYLLHDRYPVNLSNSPRWNAEGGCHGMFSWESAAAWLSGAPAFVGCNSALHVLARAMDVPVVMMEPNPHRHNEIFYPYGKTGSGVELVLGNDGLPTFDARAVWETLCKVLAESSARPGAGSGGTTISSSSPIPKTSPAAASGSSVAAAATAPPDGIGSFSPETHDNWQVW